MRDYHRASVQGLPASRRLLHLAIAAIVIGLAGHLIYAAGQDAATTPAQARAETQTQAQAQSKSVAESTPGSIQSAVDPDLRSAFTPDDPQRAPWHPSPTPRQPYQPYNPVPQPREVAADQITAKRIILDGTRCKIILDVQDDQPGITVYSKRTGEIARLCVIQDGRAVVGIHDATSPKWSAGLYASRGAGMLQLYEPEHRGAWTLTGSAIANQPCPVPRQPQPQPRQPYSPSPSPYSPAWPYGTD
jgi:hypothetical protein